MSDKSKILKRVEPKIFTVLLPGLIGLLLLGTILFFLNSAEIDIANILQESFPNKVAVITYLLIVSFVIFSFYKVFFHWNSLKLESEDEYEFNLFYQYRNYSKSEKYESFNFFKELKKLYDDGRGLNPLPGEEILKNELDLFDARMSILKYLANSSVIAGILGTFVGLVFAVKGASIAIANGGADSNIMDALQGSLGNLYIAFYTSIVGILGSLSIGLGHLLIKRDTVTLVLEIEKLLPDMLKEIDTKESVDNRPEIIAIKRAISGVGEPIKEGIKGIKDEIAQAFRDEFKNSVELFGQKLDNFGGILVQFKQTLEKDVEAMKSQRSEMRDEFKDGIKKLTKTVSDSLENELKSHIKFLETYRENTIKPLFDSLTQQLENANVSITNAQTNIEALAKNSRETIEDNYKYYNKRMKNLNESIKSLTEEITNIKKESSSIRKNTGELNTKIEGINTTIGGLSNKIKNFTTNYNTLLENIDEHSKSLQAVKNELNSIFNTISEHK